MVLRLVLGLSGPGGNGLATLCVGGDGPDQGLLSVWQDLLIPDVFAHCPLLSTSRLGMKSLTLCIL